MELNFHRATVDPKFPMQPTYYGTFCGSVEVGGQRRRFFYYVPDGVMASTAGVMLLPPDGVCAETFLRESDWKHLCESEECKEKLIICVLEAGAEGWLRDEEYGGITGDVAYIQAVYREFSRRNLFCVHESKYYLVGYDGGALAAQHAALSCPSIYAGLTCVDSPPVAAAYREAANAALCINLDGFEDEIARKGICKRDIPLPVWLIASNSERQAATSADLQNWCARCGAEQAPGRFAPDTFAFVRREEPPYPTNQDRAAYRVWSSLIPDAQEAFGRFVNRRIWKDFLSRVRRWMSEPGGSLRITEDPIRDMHCEYHYEMVDSWMREWYVYVPDSVRRNPGKSVPVVFANHGYSCTGEIYLGNSGWNRVAERYGFLVVAATAPFDNIHGRGENEAYKFDNTYLPTWNIFGKADRPDEIAFFRHMLADLQGRFTIDEEKLYVTGHSWGSMMTQYLGMALPHVFAAIAPCSGVLFDEHGQTLLQNPQLVQHPSVQLPIWMFVGEMEEWLFPHMPAGENAPARSIRLWWRRNRFPGPPPETFEDGWQVHGRWNDALFPKDGHPLVRYTWVSYLPHATMPEMSERIWQEFFSKVSRNLQTGALQWKD